MGGGGLGRGFGRRKKRMIRDLIHTLSSSFIKSTVNILYVQHFAKKMYKCML